MSRKPHFDKDRKNHKRHDSYSRSREREASKEREKALKYQVAVYKERTSPSKFITEELGNELTDFSLRATIRDKLNRAKNEERKKEEKIQFNFTKKKDDHSDALVKHKLIEAIENPNPDSLEHVTKLTKFNKELNHLNAMFSNDYGKDKKKKDDKANIKNKKESNDDFDINDEDLMKTFG